MNASILTFNKLSIDLERGLLLGEYGEEKRLSPINLKVLSALLAQAPGIASRNTLFDQAWPNQSVSDDTLNRCISDLRSLLSSLDPDTKYIETIPKRGYRWTASLSKPSDFDKNIEVTSQEARPSTIIKRGPIWNVLVVLLLAVGFTLFAGTMFSTLIKPTDTRLVLLFNAPASLNLASGTNHFEASLRQELNKNPYFSLIANSAIESRPASPYPYFHQHYGAKWVIEIQLLQQGNELEVRTDIVDARTGIIHAHLREVKPWPVQSSRVWQSVSYAIHEAIKALN